MTATKTVVMAAIPGELRRGAKLRRGASYARYAIACWQSWCQQHGIDLVVLDRPVDGPLADAPPPVQRWQVVRDMLGAGRPQQIAVVDADTMIRWDAPDFFTHAAGALGAVHAGTQAWLQASLDAYGVFFPGLVIDWRKCFNSGLVVLDQGHALLLDELVRFYADHLPELEALQAARNVGVDQMLLNYFVAQEAVEVRLLDPAFNRMRCFQLPTDLYREYEKAPAFPAPPPDLALLARRLAQATSGFQFIDEAYVWHFTSTVATRATVMAETWRRVHHHYVGALPDANGSPPAATGHG